MGVKTPELAFGKCDGPIISPVGDLEVRRNAPAETGPQHPGGAMDGTTGCPGSPEHQTVHHPRGLPFHVSFVFSSKVKVKVFVAGLGLKREVTPHWMQNVHLPFSHESLFLVVLCQCIVIDGTGFNESHFEHLIHHNIF